MRRPVHNALKPADADAVEILALGDPRAADPAVTGGKAASLSRLAARQRVPPGFVVALPGAPLDRSVRAAVRAAYRRLGERCGVADPPVAVRSSAVDEDAADRSAAGQYDSLMGVRAQGLREAVERVHASGANERARAYGLGGSVAVIIQREVAATRAGVAFSRDPVGRSDAAVIECAFGHGEAVVSGETTPDRFVVRDDGGVATRIAARSGRRAAIRTLRDDEARAVAGLARRAEDGFGVPVDVEFCFERRRLWLVQCRPITTL